MRHVLDAGTTPAAEPGPPEPRGWVDELSGMDGPELWAREVAKEDARNRRYRRSASVAVADIDGFGGVAATYGTAAALEAFGTVCRIVAAEIRSSDYAARIGPTRLGFLLVESDEDGAAIFVERIQTIFDRAVGPGRQMTIAFGCASPRLHEGLTEAAELAIERLAGRQAEPARVPVDDPHEVADRLDPWGHLDAAPATARTRSTLRVRLAFGMAALADLLAAAAWLLQLGLLRISVPH